MLDKTGEFTGAMLPQHKDVIDVWYPEKGL